MESDFRKDTPFEKRLEMSTRLRSTHPNRVPIILELSKDIKHLKLDHKKYLVPSDQSMGGLLNIIRKNMNIGPQEAIFLFCGNNGGVLVPTTRDLTFVYNKYKDEDGFLYITLTMENTFGAMYTFEYLTSGIFDEILKSSSLMYRYLMC